MSTPAPLSIVDPGAWIASFGRTPLVRSLVPVADIIRLKELRKHLLAGRASDGSVGDSNAEPDPTANPSLARPANKTQCGEREADQLEDLEVKIRRDFTPQLVMLFDECSLTPTNLPERVARDAVVQDLLDKLCGAGFLRMADVRDALAKHQLKLPDATLASLFHGDVLLQLNRRLTMLLPGVYHAGEVYLRGIQRFSGLAFGTPLGRWLTKFVAMPFGGAFLAVEFFKHMAHAAGDGLHRIRDGAWTPKVEHHGPMFTAESLLAIMLLGLFLLFLLHVRRFRAAVWEVVKAIGRAARLVLVTLPAWIMSTPAVQFLVNNRFTRAVLKHVALPLLLTAPMATAAGLLQASDSAIIETAAVFLFNVALCNTPWGRALRDEFLENLHEAWRYFRAEVLAEFAAWIFWLFKRTLGAIERLLHAVDETLRLRPDQPIWVKTVLAFAWFPVAYVIRFAFYLLFEPQVNPIKHFPVVTVSHKVMFGLIGTVKDALGVSLKTAGFILTMVPGIFGFLVWEFKENWKLYAANRPKALPPLAIGHHGETVRRLLRPGFHSGTLPKLFRKLKEAEDAGDAKRMAKCHREIEHVKHAIEAFIDRQVIAYWDGCAMPIARGEVSVTAQTIRVPLDGPSGAVNLEWRFAGDDVTAQVHSGEALPRFTQEQRDVFRQSVCGVLAMSGCNGEVLWSEWVEYWKIRGC